jgi:hypothetical protein
MSRNLFITCEDCKKRLWVGQGYRKFYSRELKIMEKLEDFLFDHENHKLGFRDDEISDDWYTDKEWLENYKI